MGEASRLQQIRNRIDALDETVLQLFSERAALAQEVALIKQQDGGENFYRPEREAWVLRNAMDNNPGPLDNETVVRLFREIMSACLALEQPLNIAFLGPVGTFTQQAVFKHFGHAVKTKPLTSIDDIFREVEAGAAHYGVVPVENSTEGVINHTLDMFLNNTTLHICGEIELRIHHHLMGQVADIGAIKQIVSHQQSFGQCRCWLDRHLPNVEKRLVSSNAEAARLASNSPGIAAIAGKVAAEVYGLSCLVTNIEDCPDNTTRFFVIGSHKVPISGVDKTSLLLSAKNRPGALYKLLKPLAEHGVSMTGIESRPSRKGLWQYVFFVDIEGHSEDPTIALALAELKQNVSLFKLLGSYPRAVI